jgi:D-xylose transport system permease protein
MSVDAISAPVTRRRLSARVDARGQVMILVLIGIALVFQILTDGLFLSPRNLSNLGVQAAITGVLAVGMTMLLVAGEIDLSVGASVALVGIVAATLQVDHDMATGLVVVVAVLLGGGMGLIQGSLVALIGIPSFIVTLGAMLGFRGLGYLISGSETISPIDRSFSDITGAYLAPGISVALTIGVLALVLALVVARSIRERRFATAALVNRLPVIGALLLVAWVSSSYLGLPIAVLIFAAVAAAGSALLSLSAFGRRVYVLGGNREAARYAGLSRTRIVIAIFAIMGVLYGIAGVMQTSRLGGSPPGLGVGLELDVISACVLGGTSLFGGRGTIAGTLVGVLLFQSLSNGMGLLNVSTNAQLLIRGLILVLAVGLDVVLKRRAGEAL